MPKTLPVEAKQHLEGKVLVVNCQIVLERYVVYRIKVILFSVYRQQSKQITFLLFTFVVYFVSVFSYDMFRAIWPLSDCPIYNLF
jgi:hypothetical protein